MKEKLQCDNCGGNLIHDRDDIFICEHCGTGYKLSETIKPRNDNVIRINNFSPDKISRLSMEFNSFKGGLNARL